MKTAIESEPWSTDDMLRVITDVMKLRSFRGIARGSGCQPQDMGMSIGMGMGPEPSTHTQTQTIHQFSLSATAPLDNSFSRSSMELNRLSSKGTWVPAERSTADHISYFKHTAAQSGEQSTLLNTFSLSPTGSPRHIKTRQTTYHLSREPPRRLRQTDCPRLLLLHRRLLWPHRRLRGTA